MTRTSRLAALFLALLAPVPAWAEPPTAYSQPELLRNWALARCLAKANPDSPAGEDANRAAGAYLEFGTAGIETYEKLDAMVDAWLKREYAGSVRGASYSTMKCIDLYHSRELGRFVRRRH